VVLLRAPRERFKIWRGTHLPLLACQRPTVSQRKKPWNGTPRSIVAHLRWDLKQVLDLGMSEEIVEHNFCVPSIRTERSQEAETGTAAWDEAKRTGTQDQSEPERLRSRQLRADSLDQLEKFADIMMTF
jgi:hypothetical protein